jgi:hypothetical protein
MAPLVPSLFLSLPLSFRPKWDPCNVFRFGKKKKKSGESPGFSLIPGKQQKQTDFPPNRKKDKYLRRVNQGKDKD